MQAEFKHIASDFGDAEHLEWEREIEDMKKRYERAGKRSIFMSRIDDDNIIRVVGYLMFKKVVI